MLIGQTPDEHWNWTKREGRTYGSRRLHKKQTSLWERTRGC